MAGTEKLTIVGRYMDGPTVTGYHLLGENGEQRRVSREQLIFLVGKGVITNCKGQFHKDEVLLRGVGINLNNLPVVNDKTGELRRTENIGRIARGATTEQALTQIMIVGRIVKGNKTVGFTVANAGGQTKDISRKTAEELAEKLKIGNARVQEYRGRKIIRLLNGTIEGLPITREIQVEDNRSLTV